MIQSQKTVQKMDGDIWKDFMEVENYFYSSSTKLLFILQDSVRSGVRSMFISSVFT